MTEEIKQNWYQLTGTKTKEFITLLHLPYTLMCLSFIAIGFGISEEIHWKAFMLMCVAYFLGLGIAAHMFDQIKETAGTVYIKHITQMELKTIGIISLAGSIIIGLYAIAYYNLYHLTWLMPLQVFFAIAYPMGKLFRGLFHTDLSFAFSFGFLPTVIGFYANTRGLDPIVIPFAFLSLLLAYIEILLSRHSRHLRKMGWRGWNRPDRALQILCVTTYLLGVIFLIF